MDNARMTGGHRVNTGCDRVSQLRNRLCSILEYVALCNVSRIPIRRTRHDSVADPYALTSPYLVCVFENSLASLIWRSQCQGGHGLPVKCEGDLTEVGNVLHVGKHDADIFVGGKVAVY